jgi:MoxR-like ATPase
MNSPAQANDLATAHLLRERMNAVLDAISQKVVGQSETLQQLLIALLAGGHCLLEGVPGLAKTLMVRSLADAIHMQFARVQFTPDLMPSDIIGTDIIQESHTDGSRQLIFEAGPIFTQILLADEINRTPPKTQAALLEAMQEHSVTVGRKTYQLPAPFFVLATQNPIEQEGTYPLPEAQRDRFLLQVLVTYPTREDEADIMDLTTGNNQGTIEAVLHAEELQRFQNLVRSVPLPTNVKDSILDYVRLLRPNEPDSQPWVKEFIDWGPGPRACQHLALAGKARALLLGRSVVSLEDIEALALPVLRHRIVLSFSATAQGETPDSVLQRAWKTVAPKHVSAL